LNFFFQTKFKYCINESKCFMLLLTSILDIVLHRSYDMISFHICIIKFCLNLCFAHFLFLSLVSCFQFKTKLVFVMVGSFMSFEIDFYFDSFCDHEKQCY
jgi:hypothetical protein